MREYKILRDSGSLSTPIDVSVNNEELAGLYYLTDLKVTEFPPLSVGLRFRFIVVVYTDFAIDGVKSLPSYSMILAGLPDAPSIPPSRNVASNEFTVAVNIV